MLVGVLSLQGDFHLHRKILEKLNVESRHVRHPEDLAGIDGLIIPGGESTTLTKLIERHGLRLSITKFYRAGKPIYGTCAGLILLSKPIPDEPVVKPFGFIDVEVERNSYGRQRESFESEGVFVGKKVLMHFIRAPRIKSVGKGVEILMRHGSDPVLVRQKNILASSFHPEVSGETAVHEYFIGMCNE